MTTKATFETAVIADAIKKANCIAPTRGKEFDLYKGIIIEIRPVDDTVCIRSTNGEVYYNEFIDAVKLEGSNADWRVPSTLVTGIVSNLPVGSGKLVTLESTQTKDKHFVSLFSGRTKARMPLIIEGFFPEWESFDSTSMFKADGLAAMLELVAWASDKGNLPPLNGVYIDNERLLATDKIKIATVDFKFDTGENPFIVLPANVLTSVLRGMEELQVKVEGNFLCIAPDNMTQIKCILYSSNFLNLSKVLKIENEELVMLNRDLVNEVLTRCLTVGSSDRQLPLLVTVGDEEIVFTVRNEGKTEEIIDSIYLKDQCTHEPVTYSFTPDIFVDSIARSPAREVIFHYNLTEQKSGVQIDGGSGYKVIIRPRIQVKEGAGSYE